MTFETKTMEKLQRNQQNLSIQVCYTLNINTNTNPIRLNGAQNGAACVGRYYKRNSVGTH